MQVHVHILTYNEADVIGWTLAHYAQFADRIVVHDAGSDDGTREVVSACPVAELLTDDVGIAGGLNDAHHLAIKDTCWRGRGADWVFCIDADEIVTCPTLPVRSALARFGASGQGVPRPRGYDMIGPLPAWEGRANDQLAHHVTRGVFADGYSKCCLFRGPQVQSMGWGPGLHEAYPTSADGRPLPVRWADPELALLHMRWLGTPQRILERKRTRARRLSETNLAHGWGLQSVAPDAVTLAEYAEIDRAAVAVPGCGRPAPAYTTGWGGPHAGTWDEFIRPAVARDGARALEIGCWEGKASRWLLGEAMSGWRSALTVVDTFLGAEDLADHGTSAAGVRERLTINVAPWRDRIRVLEGRSLDVLRAIANAEDGTFDFCYVDGSHQAADTLTDAVLSWPLLRPGGVLAFDDYGWNIYPEAHRRPGPAIDAFLECFAGRYDLLHKDYQVIVKKRW